MSITNTNWLNSHESRRYPLDDTATGTGDDGARIKDDILADVSLTWPSLAGQYAFVGGINISDRLVSVVFLAADSPTAASGFTPLGAVTLARPVNRYQPYPINAIYPGTGGFVSFGDTDEPVNLRFSSPQQGLLSPRTSKPYDNLPIPSMRKAGRLDGLTGLVKLLPGPDVEIKKTMVVVNGAEQPAIKISLLAPTGAQNVLSKYVGPCGARPESRNCQREGVETVNGVGPDCYGNLEIKFTGLTAGPYDDCGSLTAGVTLDQPLGISEVCRRPVTDGITGTDYCAVESSSSSMSSSASLSEILPMVAPMLLAETQLSLPLQDTFSDELPDHWWLRRGAYSIVTTGSGTSCLQLTDASQRTVLTLTSFAGLVNTRATATVQLLNGHFPHNVGVVLNHTADSYFGVMLNRQSHRVEFVRFTGVSTVVWHAAAPTMPFNFTDWYTITVTVLTTDNNSHIIQATVTSDDPDWPSVSFAVPVNKWVVDNGRYGLCAHRSQALCCYWELSDA